MQRDAPRIGVDRKQEYLHGCGAPVSWTIDDEREVRDLHAIIMNDRRP